MGAEHRDKSVLWCTLSDQPNQQHNLNKATAQPGAREGQAGAPALGCSVCHGTLTSLETGSKFNAGNAHGHTPCLRTCASGDMSCVDWNSWLAAVARISSSPVSVPGSKLGSSCGQHGIKPGSRSGQARLAEATVKGAERCSWYSKHMQFPPGGHMGHTEHTGRCPCSNAGALSRIVRSLLGRIKPSSAPCRPSRTPQQAGPCPGYRAPAL